MSKLSKTPVSLLQELMGKRNITPSYDLLPSSEGIGTHSPIFCIKVTTTIVEAVGKGRSKKDAKHEAARNALEKLANLGKRIMNSSIQFMFTFIR